MRNLMIKSLAVSMLIGLFAFVSSARDGRERVRFARGATSTVLKRTLSADDGVITFVVNARKGQRMHFTVEGAEDIGVSLSVPGAQDAELESGTGEPNEYRIVKTGDHYITVVNRTGKKANITLRLGIK